MKNQIIQILEKAKENNLSFEETALLLLAELEEANAHLLIPWPESQDMMNRTWFDEKAVLADNSNYFVPIQYINYE